MIIAETTIAGFMIPACIHRDVGGSLSDGEQAIFSDQALIDTGASAVFIDPSVAAALNLKQVDQSEIETAGGRVGVLVYSGVLEVPLLGYKERIELRAPKVKRISYSIVLGRSFLRQYHIVIDGPNDLLTFSRPGLVELPDDDHAG
jgi:predicted aspartyl protease